MDSDPGRNPDINGREQLRAYLNGVTLVATSVNPDTAGSYTQMPHPVTAAARGMCCT